ncbi:DUF4760 domain-containing protein [Clostridium perfringens]|uniref:DUF4760 domain-containing protein n=1 Tax=Clostridium perfringens TaxID=1502 RepID=UPI0024BC4934|nr:DUF4760 domain-containing protein [Clostridium perfringens]
MTVQALGQGCQIVANIATTITLVFLWIQNKISKKQNYISNSKQEKQKAIELAELYAEEIIPKMSYIQKLYREIGVEEDLKNIKFQEMKFFDINEMKNLLTDEKIKAIIKKQENIKIEQLIECSQALECTESKLNDFSIFRQIQQFNEEVAATSNQDKRRIKLLANIKEMYYKNEYTNVLTKILNQLEYFSMYFNTGVADESVVYQSLHQSFMYTVKVLYFDISIRNKAGKDKYYTNIIQLYNSWSEKYHEKEKIEIENDRSMVTNPKKIKR